MYRFRLMISMIVKQTLRVIILSIYSQICTYQQDHLDKLLETLEFE